MVVNIGIPSEKYSSLQMSRLHENVFKFSLNCRADFFHDLKLINDLICVAKKERIILVETIYLPKEI